MKLASQNPPAPEPGSAAEMLAFLNSRPDEESRTVRWLQAQRVVDRLERIKPHLREQTVANEVREGKFERLLALREVDRAGEVVPAEAVERLMVERGRALRPDLARAYDEQEQEVADLISASHERAVEASRVIKETLGVDPDSILDRGAFLGQPRRPASYAEHLANQAKTEAAPPPAA